LILIPKNIFTIDSPFNAEELERKLAKVVKAEPGAAPHMPLKYYWGTFSEQAFHIAPVYRGPELTEQVNEPALVFFRGEFRPGAGGTQVAVDVVFTMAIKAFAWSWYAVCVGTLAFLVITLVQTVRLGQFTPVMSLLMLLPLIMAAVLYVPLRVYLWHETEHSQEYLKQLFTQDVIPQYDL